MCCTDRLVTHLLVCTRSLILLVRPTQNKDAKPKPGEAMFQQYRKAGKPVLPQLQMSVPLTCTIDTDLKP